MKIKRPTSNRTKTYQRLLCPVFACSNPDCHSFGTCLNRRKYTFQHTLWYDSRCYNNNLW